MKNKYLVTLIIVLTMLLTGCSGSKAIRGAWNAQDSEGNNYVLEFDERKITLSQGEEKETLTYEQNAVGTENGIKYYGLTIDNVSYSVIFPEKENQDLALFVKVTDEDNYLEGNLVYAINKNDEPNYQDYASKYIH